jgi:asparagine synthase (glutamine-hydrolysing)
MCGICGVVDLAGRPIDARVGEGMMDLLWHRGPDGGGQQLLEPTPPGSGPGAFLGHRRLRIIDLSEAAAQPLPNEDGTVWVVFNGEIYNFRELRADLAARGHVFNSQSDTETIVHGYETFGDDVVTRLDGMFALALWDVRRRRLLLARDRTGKKPLFYTFDGQRLTFASEIKALLACPWVERRIAVDLIPELLTFGYVHAPATLYESVRQVPPASVVVLDAQGLRGPHRYWHLRFAADGNGNGHRLSPEAAAQRVRALLTEAVARRLVSDVPLGALLSGGLDSSIVVGLMARLQPEPVRTFTIGWADAASFDERPFAAEAARHFGTDHTECVVGTDAVGLIESLLWHHDQPYGDSSAIPTWVVSHQARQHVTVALNGDGGDEVFAGYDRFLAALVAGRIPRWVAPLGQALARGLPRHHGYYSVRRRLERLLETPGASIEDRFLGWTSVFALSSLLPLLRPELAAGIEAERLHAGFNRWRVAADDQPLLHRLLHVSFMTNLPDDLHVKMDRMSMAHGLETRSPMLDTALVEFVASLPPGLKIRRTELKYVLKLAFRDLLPPALLTRKKHGFSVPLAHWLRHQLRDYVADTLLSPDARLRRYLDQGVVRRLVQEHVEGVQQHRNRLWLLLTFEAWLRMLEAGTLWQSRRAEPAAALTVTEVTRRCYA